MPIYVTSAAAPDEVAAARAIIAASPAAIRDDHVPMEEYGSSTLIVKRDPGGAAENWRAVLESAARIRIAASGLPALREHRFQRIDLRAIVDHDIGIVRVTSHEVLVIPLGGKETLLGFKLRYDRPRVTGPVRADRCKRERPLPAARSQETEQFGIASPRQVPDG